jgi:ATP-dependent DNA helicase Rep
MDALADALLAETGYEAHLRTNAPDKAMFERRLAHVGELLEWLKEGARRSGDGDLAAQLAILTNADRDDPGNAVRLMTLHSAKGLEFRHVYLVGCEEGLLPHASAIDEGRIEEERRLFYVGMTRAKRSLTLTLCRARSRYGREESTEPSRFLGELPASEVRWLGRPDLRQQSAEQKAQAARPHLDAIKALLGA